jgi:hypothetical protein
MEFRVRNVNTAFDELGHWLALAGVEENSRNGPVLVAPEPVTVTYTAPQERVLFSPLRDANPFFHLLGDALWSLAGRNNIAWPTYFNSKYEQYSDDGVIQHGAYGHRWRQHFGYDQLEWIVLGLECQPYSRREVLMMWDPGTATEECTGDLYVGGHGGRDVPCNVCTFVDLRGGALNITVINRSNDFIFGMLGANVVVFSCLQEYFAAALKVPVGKFTTFSNNVHVYASIANRTQLRELAVDAGIHGKPYPKTFPLINTDIPTWEEDLKKFMDRPGQEERYQDIFFSAVARPMYRAWAERKEHRGTGLEWARLIGAEDWRRACVEWIVRRERQL